MAKLVQPPPRFTHEDWTRSNLTKYANADVERQGAERLVEESKRLDNETRRRVEKTQADVHKKLEQRLDDIRYWKKELDDKLAGLVTEIDSLLAFKKRVEKALQATDEPLHIARQCLANRERRLKIDLVHDDVQKELLKEVETLEGVQALLQRTLEEATEQLRLNRKAKYLLEKDLKDKFQAQDIDEYCENLRNNSAGLHLKNGATKIEANSVSPEEWQDFSNENIENAERERQNSVNLRSNIDGILQQVSNDQRKQVDATNLAFSKRIGECKDTKGKLEDHLNRVIGQIKEIEENISRLQKAIADKEDPMKLAHTRLDTRSQRPNVELCRDAVQYRLIEEVGELECTLAQLRSRLADTQDSLKGLTRNQLDLEDDIQVKANTLFIDEVECMGMRKSINIQQF
ncbi:tektin-1-like [Babylonia areolata]|uniref:tektin-1-like n=1 Tax=Babylonia areolata TaxID=304850 RepID=UPI003FD5E038